MKRVITSLLAVSISVIGVLALALTRPAAANYSMLEIQENTPFGPVLSQEAGTEIEAAVQGLYFYANDCPHCLVVMEEVIQPMQAESGDLLDIRLLDIGIPEYYEAMMVIEAYFDVPASKRSIPTLIIADQILIGETEIRDNFSDLVREGIEEGGVAGIQIPGIEMQNLVSVKPDPLGESNELCDTEENCAVDLPIFAAYFYQTGCKECSRVEADLNYLRSIYPQLQVVEFNIYDHADLAEWLTVRIDPDRDFSSPALFIGDNVLFGEEILPENITPIIEQNVETGTEPVWLDFDPKEGQQSIIDRFKNMGWLAVVTAGLIDGINPCAFATLIFFVSYLTLSGRSGKEILLVGGSFTMGVFLTYLAVGLGLYQILEYLGDILDIFAKIVYLLTGIFCLFLAVVSFLDYRKARQGEVGDMFLKLPEPLRKRINATIRKGRHTSNYVMGAFGAGLLISLLELACTGQVYLPTIIFVSSIPGLRVQAVLYLILYNLLFILPLVIIFVLVYYGTTSKDLTSFMQKNAAAVKFAMGIIFIALGGWLLFSSIL